MDTSKKIIVDNVSKIYNMYNSPTDRLKEAFSVRGRSLHSEFYALKNISFTVSKGEILGIMGRNGAGKSTLLKIITGVLLPTYGQVILSGRISSLLELGAGFNPEYSGIENIYFYGTIMGLTHEQISQKLDEILEFAEIGDYVYQPVKTYSSGMFARLAFSCAINVEPDVLIVDEILSVGDIRFQAKCFNKFKEFKEQGVTILYVGHDVSTMRSFCDRCIWLNQGEIVDSGDPTYITAKYVEFMYLEDISDFTSYKAYQKDEVHSSEKEIAEHDLADTLESGVNTVERPSLDKRSEKMASGKPLAHWGSMTGLICNISMTVNEKEIVSCSPFDFVTVSFTIPYIDNIDYKYLSAAFSIKNTEGRDLIVKTTYEVGIELHDDLKNGIKFSFTFMPRLTNGDYYLVLALENHEQSVTSYYEYIEGARYFKVFQNKEIYGQFIPDIAIGINGEKIDEPD